MPRQKALADDSTSVKTQVPAEAAAALDVLVAVTDTNRATMLRHVIVAGLQTFARVNPEVTAALPATTYNKKEK